MCSYIYKSEVIMATARGSALDLIQNEEEKKTERQGRPQDDKDGGGRFSYTGPTPNVPPPPGIRSNATDIPDFSGAPSDYRTYYSTASQDPRLEERRRMQEQRISENVRRRIEKTTTEIYNSLTALRRKQRIERERLKLRQDQEVRDSLAGKQAPSEADSTQLVTTDTEGNTTDANALDRDLERRRRRLTKSEKKNEGRQSDSISSEEGLAGPVMRLSKVMTRLNDPDLRDKQEILERNARHLERITRRTVENGLEKSMDPIEKNIDWRISEQMSKLMIETAEKVKHEIYEDLEQRIRRIEDNEKVSSRVCTEKHDEILPLDFYPNAPASDDSFKRAMVQLNYAVKVIERLTTFSADPFNFVMMVAAESNKVAKDFALSQMQQKNLILSHIPSTNSLYSFLDMADSLKGMLSVISKMANKVSTRNDLEKQIDMWRLTNSSEPEMYSSILDLLKLLDRNRDDYGRKATHIPTLFKSAIARIAKQENLPRIVREALFESRLKIRDDDAYADIVSILLSACHKWIGMRSQKQVKSLTYEDPNEGCTSWEGASSHQQVFSVHTDSEPVEDSAYEDDMRTESGSTGTGNENSDSEPEDPDDGSDSSSSPNAPENDTDVSDAENDEHTGYVKRYVEIWPHDKPYVSKSGYSLSTEFENHFRNHCFKCGHWSHISHYCKVYPDKTATLSICTKCRQGLHPTASCKSTRPDLKQKAAMEKTVMDEVNKHCAKLSHFYQHPFQAQYYYQYQFPPTPSMIPPTPPLLAVGTQPAVTNVSSDSDSE